MQQCNVLCRSDDMARGEGFVELQLRAEVVLQAEVRCLRLQELTMARSVPASHRYQERVLEWRLEAEDQSRHLPRSLREVSTHGRGIERQLGSRKRRNREFRIRMQQAAR